MLNGFRILQDHFEQAVSCSYETVLLGHRSAQPQLIAASTVNVAKAGQRYVEMLAEVVARLVKDGHGRPAAKVRPMQLFWYSMHLFTEQPAVLLCCCTVTAAYRWQQDVASLWLCVCFFEVCCGNSHSKAIDVNSGMSDTGSC